MYLHVGWDEVLRAEEIVTICDVECWNSCKENRDMLDEAEGNGKVRRIRFRDDGEQRDVRSVIVYRDHILLSPITSTTLQQRANVVARSNEPRGRLP